jgi:hypothetical protein
MSKLIIKLISILMVILLMAAFGANAASASGEYWLSGWANRVKLTIDHNKIDGTLSNFPVMVHLSSSSGISAADVSFVFNSLGTDANRKKIAVTTSDGKTQLYVEIENWDSASKQAWLWVKVPSISNNVDTDLYLYYDSNHADNNNMVGDTGSAPAQNVWNNTFVLVHHYAESGNGTKGEFKDSTNHGNHGTGGGGNSSGTPTRTTG